MPCLATGCRSVDQQHRDKLHESEVQTVSKPIRPRLPAITRSAGPAGLYVGDTRTDTADNGVAAKLTNGVRALQRVRQSLKFRRGLMRTSSMPDHRRHRRASDRDPEYPHAGARCSSMYPEEQYGDPPPSRQARRVSVNKARAPTNRFVTAITPVWQAAEIRLRRRWPKGSPAPSPAAPIARRTKSSPIAKVSDSA